MHRPVPDSYLDSEQICRANPGRSPRHGGGRSKRHPRSQCDVPANIFERLLGTAHEFSFFPQELEAPDRLVLSLSQGTLREPRYPEFAAADSPPFCQRCMSRRGRGGRRPVGNSALSTRLKRIGTLVAPHHQNLLLPPPDTRRGDGECSQSKPRSGGIVGRDFVLSGFRKRNEPKERPGQAASVDNAAVGFCVGTRGGIPGERNICVYDSGSDGYHDRCCVYQPATKQTQGHRTLCSGLPPRDSLHRATATIAGRLGSGLHRRTLVL
mmetsp:Transcript_28463/g.77081  ORF Transcript_28463/g.77081 Transcript_28463/m.77081 type:complete len:267 (-) Transcript_28463:2764-3564(-)